MGGACGWNCVVLFVMVGSGGSWQQWWWVDDGGGSGRIFKSKKGVKRKKCNILEREKMRCEVARGGNMELFCPLKDA